MKKLAVILVAIILVHLLPVTACQTGENKTHTPIPVKDMGVLWAEQEAPDDIMPVPGGGPAYRANIQQQGIKNPWPSIEVSEAYLGSGVDEAHIYYRSHIETAAGETRNNVIKAIIPSKEVNNLMLYADDVPQGITLTDGMQWSGPSARASVLVIEISPNIAPGQYDFEIGIEVEGKDYGTIPCTIGVVEATIEKPTESGVYHSEEGDLTISLPDGWVAVEGPEYLTHPYDGQVAFNSWGENGFWAREVRTGSSSSYSTQIAMSQILEGGAYVALVRIWGPPRMPDYAPPEYTPDDLSGLCQPHDWRQDSATDAQFIQFYKWGRDLRLEVACHPGASDKTVAELNDLLESWRFDSVPEGDIEWAGIQARKLLPEEVEPLKFSNRAGSRSDDGVDRVTEVETKGSIMSFRFIYRWDNSSHWWTVEVSPIGEAIITGDGGDLLPFD